MITLIGGRIIPAFSRNWLTKQRKSDRLPPAHTVFDGLVIGAAAAASLFWVLWPDTRSPGLIRAAAGLLLAARLTRWRGLSPIRHPPGHGRASGWVRWCQYV